MASRGRERGVFKGKDKRWAGRERTGQRRCQDGTGRISARALCV